MNDWAVVFLGIIAVATLATAIAQVGLLVAAGLLVRRMAHLVERVEQDMKPVFEHLNSIGRDASRAAGLATAQVERVDRLVGDVIQRIEQLGNVLQVVVAGRATDASAVLRGIRAFASVFRKRRRSRAEDEEAMFI